MRKMNTRLITKERSKAKKRKKMKKKRWGKAYSSKIQPHLPWSAQIDMLKKTFKIVL